MMRFGFGLKMFGKGFVKLGKVFLKFNHGLGFVKNPSKKMELKFGGEEQALDLLGP